MKLLCLSAADLRRALPMDRAVEVMKEAFAALSTGRAAAPPRAHMVVEPAAGTTLLMGAALPGIGLAAKVVSVFPGNAERGRSPVTGLVLVLDPETGEPAALVDGTYLTALRTGAAGGAATDLLARSDAHIGAVLGCGAQARTQALALDAVRSLEVLRVYGRRPAAARAFAEEIAPDLSCSLEISESAEAAVRDADVICAATSSATPVLRGEWLAPGAHVNGVGSFTPKMQEVDAETVGRARIFIDSREGALAEAGDLLIAEQEGRTRRETWTEIGLVAAGHATGRQSEAEVTFFKSVGHAVQDVAAAARALESARELGLGTVIEI